MKWTYGRTLVIIRPHSTRRRVAKGTAYRRWKFPYDIILYRVSKSQLAIGINMFNFDLFKKNKK